MKTFKRIAMATVILTILIVTISCASNDTTPEGQLITVPQSQQSETIPTETSTTDNSPQKPGETTATVQESEAGEMNFKGIDYYIESRANRYLDYAKAHPDASSEAVVLNVNMDLDYDFYSHISEISDPSDLLVLCNKYNQLPDYTPESLTDVPVGYYVEDGKSYKMSQVALDAFIEMANAAAKDGVSLKIISGYRTYSYQEGLYNRYVNNHGKDAADTFSARPGHSEHETGLACDINDVSDAFENTDAFQWLSENAADYGYIMRYPKGLESETGYMYESWHYRYVGSDIAKTIKAQNLTYDAYYAMYVLPFE